MADEFDHRRARSKRPCPIWVDALFRDTATFEADEFGAYVRILLTMWSKRDCAIEDDDRRLARAAGVSLRLWRSRIGPLIRPLLTGIDGQLVTQKRLLQEAEYIEAHLIKQSKRRRKSDVPENGVTQNEGLVGNHDVRPFDNHENAENSDKSLNFHKQGQSADTSVDTSVDTSAVVSYPTTQQPNIGIGSGGITTTTYTNGGGGFSHTLSRSDFDEIIKVIGRDKLRNEVQFQTAEKWATGLGIDPPTIVKIVSQVVTTMKGDRPNSLRYFNAAMARYATARDEPTPENIAAAPIRPPRRKVRAQPPKD